MHYYRILNLQEFIMRTIRTLALAAAVSFLPIAAFAAAEIGKPAPAFKAKDINGAEQSLEKYKGKIVVLEWNNPECPFVMKHYKSGNMQAVEADLEKSGVVWLTVNSSAKDKQGSMTPAEAKAMLKAADSTPTAYILDAEGTIGKAYGATATPHMFVVDKKGTLAYAGAIDDKPGFDEAEIKGATNYVKQAVNELIDDKPVSVASTQAYGCSVKYKE